MRLEQRLGWGTQGRVFATSAGTAVKAYGLPEPFERELLCYLRLETHAVRQVLGYRVPQLFDADEGLL